MNSQNSSAKNTAKSNHAKQYFDEIAARCRENAAIAESLPKQFMKDGLKGLSEEDSVKALIALSAHWTCTKIPIRIAHRLVSLLSDVALCKIVGGQIIFPVYVARLIEHRLLPAQGDKNGTE